MKGTTPGHPTSSGGASGGTPRSSSAVQSPPASSSFPVVSDMLGRHSSSSSGSTATRSEQKQQQRGGGDGGASSAEHKGRGKQGGGSGESRGTWKTSESSTWGLGSLSLLSGSSMTHRLADMGRSLVASLSSAPVESSFIEKGTLTPQEFVDAGDQLSFKFPTWQWQGSLSGHRKCSWLPPDKQYLIAKSVPCYRRVREMDQALLHQESDGGWLLPLLLENDEQSGDKEQGLPELTQAAAEHALEQCNVIPSSSSSSGNSRETRPHLTSQFPQNQQQRETVRGARHMATTTAQESCTRDDELPKENAIPDISSLTDIDDLLQEEDDPAGMKAPTYFLRNAPDAEIVAARTYDVSITYDKYFQTPRIWLFGYNENGVPLSPEEIFQDILTEYAAKTVTVDPHPCTGIPTASIHPCRHATVMKKVVDGWIERGLKPRHDLALLALLKFISSVMPTIEYDFTMDIDMFIHSMASEKLK